MAAEYRFQPRAGVGSTIPRDTPMSETSSFHRPKDSRRRASLIRSKHHKPFFHVGAAPSLSGRAVTSVASMSITSQPAGLFPALASQALAVVVG
jgi:hypothetical protein